MVNAAAAASTGGTSKPANASPKYNRNICISSGVPCTTRIYTWPTRRSAGERETRSRVMPAPAMPPPTNASSDNNRVHRAARSSARMSMKAKSRSTSAHPEGHADHALAREDHLRQSPEPRRENRSEAEVDHRRVAEHLERPERARLDGIGRGGKLVRADGGDDARPEHHQHELADQRWPRRFQRRQDDDVGKDFPPRQTERLRGLDLAGGNRLDAAAHDLTGIGRKIERQRDDGGLIGG